MARSNLRARASQAEGRLGERFQRLPVELQREIWRQCIPRRAVDVYALEPRQLPAQVPAIAHVCQEARDVVNSRQGGLRETCDGKTTWWDPETSIALFVHISFIIRPHILPENHILQFLAPHTPICLGSYDINYLQTDEGAALRNGRPIFISVERPIDLHLTPEEALKSNLFGIFAEEDVTVVPLGDTARIAKFRKLFEQQNPKYQLLRDMQQELLKNLGRIRTRQPLVDRYTNTIEYRWTCFTEQGSLPSEVKAAVFEAASTSCLPQTGDEAAEAMGLFRHIPWAQDRLKTLPLYEMVLIFRYQRL